MDRDRDIYEDYNGCAEIDDRDADDWEGHYSEPPEEPYPTSKWDNELADQAVEEQQREQEQSD